MQKCFNIQTSTGSYSVEIAQGLLRIELAKRHDAVIIIDSNLLDYIKDFTNEYIAIEASEHSKDLSQIPDVISKLRRIGVNRNTVVIGIGGGVIQDISCFCASIYMRGLEWHYFPTTTLGMMDSCIGGKSSINVNGTKNLVGNIYPSSGVYIDPTFTKTLSHEHLIAGIFEAVKICYAMSFRSDEQFTELCSQIPKYLELKDLEDFSTIATISLMEKKWFIENDEFDKKERQMLNFGHTFGHAIESATHYSIPHGVAVGIGMLYAIQVQKSISSISDFEIEHQAKLKSVILKLLENTHYISEFKAMDFGLFLNAFEGDKKHTKGEYMVILPQKDGIFALKKVGLPKNSYTLAMLHKCFEEL